ncbi:MAG TPA: hypothetical protein VE710_00120 [Candidatus Bathyarchaeia archaeon]|nr:hypothetical protein [Candidatus Bathyarchaeia archaeon]
MFEILELLYDSYYPVLYLLSGMTATLLFTRQRTLSILSAVNAAPLRRRDDQPAPIKVESYPVGILCNLAFRLTRMKQANRKDDDENFLPAF